MSKSKPTFLYKHYDVNGTLLYVGISLSHINRLSQHNRSPWFAKIANISIGKYATRNKAMDAESKAIFEEQPKYNKAWKTSSRDNRAVYRVQGYLTKKENDDFEKLCAKNKKRIGPMVVIAVRKLMYSQTRI